MLQHRAGPFGKTNRINGRQGDFTMSKSKTRSSFGSIQYLSTDRYRVFWEVPPGPDGKRGRRSKTIIGTRRDAEDFLAAMRLSPGSAMTYRQLHLRMAEEEAKLAKGTRLEYARSWSVIEAAMGSRQVASTTSAEAERVIRSAGSPSAQRKVLRYWRKMCNWAVHEGVMASNPIDKYIRTDKVERNPKRLILAEEVPGWMEAVRGIKYEALLLCELGGGLSPEEACALDREDVAPLFRNGKVYAVVRIGKALTSVAGAKHLKCTKNEFRMREMVIGAPFAERILERSQGSGPICPSGMPRSDARPEQCYTSPVTISKNWKAWCERNGVPYVKQANMRSSFSTLHGEALSPDSVVSGAMGHAGDTTKRRWYQQVTRTALINIADNLERYLADVHRDFLERDGTPGFGYPQMGI